MTAMTDSPDYIRNTLLRRAKDDQRAADRACLIYGEFSPQGSAARCCASASRHAVEHYDADRALVD